ncbi:unnamed protein product [Candida verbasci]|uniref:Uncharacterized protein n=1 Tax=Candida verbasci TaxID=1227364 RepID=A0A9W4U0P0_9ASCO|nr:unnamed protein product [Candida verbasci]
MSRSSTHTNTFVSVHNKLHTEQLKTIHLYDITHEAQNSLIPQLSNYYSNLYYATAEKNQINIPQSIEQKFCEKCLSLFIPGYNVIIRIKYNKNGGRRLRFRCLSCRHLQYDDRIQQGNKRRKRDNDDSKSDVEIRIHRHDREGTVETENTEQSVNEDENDDEKMFRSENGKVKETEREKKRAEKLKVKEPMKEKEKVEEVNEKNLKSKERMKKRKQSSSLLTMLQNKRDEESKNSKLNSLSLMDILQ